MPFGGGGGGGGGVSENSKRGVKDGANSSCWHEF